MMLLRSNSLPILIALAMATSPIASAQQASDESTAQPSAIELISGFDLARIDAAYPPSDPAAAGELAKLVYRLQSVNESVLVERARGNDPQSVGQAMPIDGTIRSIEFVDVPPELVEFLEFRRLKLIVVQSGENDLTVVTANVSNDAAIGDRVRGVGVVIESASDRSVTIASPRLSWIPDSAPSVGWQMLAGEGVDIGALADVSTRNRKPLMAADADAFYAIMSASANVATRTDLPAAPSIGATKLLTDAKSLAGQWMQLDLETVQITRIAVTQPNRRSQLGSDHYFQIDAVAELGNAIIKIESSDDSDGSAATFERRYPVSIVVRDLPPFLNKTIWEVAGPDAVVAEVSRQISIEGFFFRLWSYQTEYMQQFGGDDQFGPLLIAAKITDKAITSSDPVGVAMIGWLAAIGIFGGLIATVLWHRYTTAGDRAVSTKRKQREADDIDFI